MLHGEIKINGIPLGAWKAVRLGSVVSPDVPSKYKWSYTGKPVPNSKNITLRGELMHLYKEGNVVLTYRVMAEILDQLKEVT